MKTIKALIEVSKWILRYNAKCAEMRYWKIRYNLLKIFGTTKHGK